MSDIQTDEAQDWLQTALQLMGLPDRVEAIASPGDANSAYWLVIDHQNLTEAQLQALLDREGEALDALQFLLNTTLHLRSDSELSFAVELADQRRNRQQRLVDMAWEAAGEVRRTGEEYVFGNLSPAERRQIHLLLQDQEDLSTFSRGKEPDRRLVVRPRSDEEPEEE